MSYLVLARKCRPQRFDEVVGQEPVTTTLKNAIRQGRTGHAYLFSGPRGVGKTTTARILAKALNCEQGPAPEPCNQCPVCREITAGSSLDVFEIDGASNRGIEEIRNLRENVKFAPSQARFKIYIIDEVHMLTDPAFNALLKTLEEPPAHVKFIFCTTAAHKVLPTILSRCQRFDFRRIGREDLIARLRQIAAAEKVEVDGEVLIRIARAADGSMRDAQSILDQLISYAEGKIELKEAVKILGIPEPELLREATRRIVERDTAGALKLVDRIFSGGRDASQFVGAFLQHVRNLCVARLAADTSAGGAGAEAVLDLSAGEVKELSAQAAAFTMEDLLAIFQFVSRAQFELKSSSSARLVLEILMIKLTRREDLSSLAEILEKLDRLAEETGGGGGEPEPPRKSLPALPTEKAGPPMPPPEPPAVKRSDAGKAPVVAAPAEDEEAPEAAEFSLEQVKAGWPRVVAAVKEKKISIGTFLNEGRPLAAARGKITIGFSENSRFHREVLDGEANRKLIEASAAAVLGARPRLELIIVRDFPVEVPEAPDEEEVPPEETAPAGNGPAAKPAAGPPRRKSAEAAELIDSARRIFDGKIIRTGRKE